MPSNNSNIVIIIVVVFVVIIKDTYSRSGTVLNTLLILTHLNQTTAL